MLRLCLSMTLFFLLSACSKFELTRDGSSKLGSLSTKSVVVRWAASKEVSVNSSGGGYRITYGQNDLGAGSSQLDIPFQPGKPLPSDATLGLRYGINKVRITAYSKDNPIGNSTEVSVNVQ